MPSNTKNLNIAIVVDPSSARQGAAAVKKIIIREMIAAGKVISRLGGFADFSQLKAQLSQVQQLAKGSLLGTGAEVESPKIAGLRKEVDRLTASVKRLRGSGGGAKGKAGKVGKGTVTDWALKPVKAAGPFSDLNKREKALAQFRKNTEMKMQSMVTTQLRQAKERIKSIERMTISVKNLNRELAKDRATKRNIAIKNMTRSVQQYNKALTKQVAIQKSLNKAAMSRMTKSVKELDKYLGAVREASSATGISKKRIGGLGLDASEIKRMTNAFKTLNQAARRAAKGIDSVNKVIKDGKSDVIVKGQGSVMGMDPNKVGSAAAELERLGSKSADLNKLIKERGYEIGKTHGKFKKLARSTMNYMKFQIGWFLGAGVIFGIVGAITQAARAALEFSQALKDMQAITGRSEEAINLLGVAARQVGRETSMAADEAVKMGLQMIRAGLGAEQAANAMKIAAKVALVAGEDAKVVADTMSTVIMAWGKDSESDIKRIGNTIAAALNFSRLTVEDLGTAFNYLGSTMPSFNKSFEETSAILAVFSNRGVKASTMSTGLVQLLSRLAAPTEKVKTALRGMGVELNKINPLTNKFSEIIKNLADSGITAAEALDIFSVRAGRALLTALRAGSDEFERMQKLLERQGELQRQYKVAMQGPIKALEKLKGRFMDAAIVLVQDLTPAIKFTAEAVGYLGDILSHFVRFMTLLPGKIMLVGGALIYLNKYIKLTGILMSVFKATGILNALRGGVIASGVMKIVTAFKALTAAMMKNPYFAAGAIILSIAGIDKLFFDNEKSIEGLTKATRENNKEIAIAKTKYGELLPIFQDTDSAATSLQQSMDKLNDVDITEGMKKMVEYKESTLDAFTGKQDTAELFKTKSANYASMIKEVTNAMAGESLIIERGETYGYDILEKVSKKLQQIKKQSGFFGSRSLVKMYKQQLKDMDKDIKPIFKDIEGKRKKVMAEEFNFLKSLTVKPDAANIFVESIRQAAMNNVKNKKEVDRFAVLLKESKQAFQTLQVEMAMALKEPKGKRESSVDAVLEKIKKLQQKTANLGAKAVKSNIELLTKDLNRQYKIYSKTINKMKSKGKELLKVEKEIGDTRREMGDIVLSIQRKEMDAWELHYSKINELNNKQDIAVKLTGDEKVSMLKEVAAGWAGLTDKVVVDGEVIISSYAAQYDAIKNINNITQIITATQEAKKQSIKDEMAILAQSKEDAIAAMEEIKGKLEDFPLDQELKLNVDTALSQINTVAKAIMALGDIKPAVVVQAKVRSSPERPFSEGIEYMKNKLDSLKTDAGFIFDFKNFSSMVSQYSSLQNKTMDRIQKLSPPWDMKDYQWRYLSAQRYIERESYPAKNFMDTYFRFMTDLIKALGKKLKSEGVDSLLNVKTEDSLAIGTPYVPKTGIYKLHKGEAVIPAKENTSNGSRSMQVTYAPVININGSNSAPREIAREVDIKLKALAKRGSSEFFNFMKRN